MANDINRIILIGRTTREPELKSSNNGTYFCRFTLASNHSQKKSDGSYEDKAGFFDCIVWGKGAETFHKYVVKGKRIAVEGRLSWSSWEKDGNKQSKVEINVEVFQFLDSKQEGQQKQPESGSAAHFDATAMENEDIPF